MEVDEAPFYFEVCPDVPIYNWCESFTFLFDLAGLLDVMHAISTEVCISGGISWLGVLVNSRCGTT